MNPSCIYLATCEDLPRLTKWLADHDKCWGDARSNPSEGIRFLLEHPTLGRIFVVRNDRQVIAMLSLSISISTAEGGYVLLVEDLIVDEAHRNQGVGSRLLDYSLHYAKENGFLRMTLSSERWTEAARQFFRRRGFVDSEMIPMRLALAEPRLDSPA